MQPLAYCKLLKLLVGIQEMWRMSGDDSPFVYLPLKIVNSLNCVRLIMSLCHSLCSVILKKLSQTSAGEIDGKT